MTAFEFFFSFYGLLLVLYHCYNVAQAANGLIAQGGWSLIRAPEAAGSN